MATRITNQKLSKSSRAWMREHLDDPFVKKAQKEGYRARAAYKLLEIQEKHKMIKPGMTVVDLGAAPGSWSQIAGKLVGDKGLVIASDILEMDALPDVTFLQGDFREEEVFEKLLNILNGRTVDVVISDMAPNTSGNRAVDQPRQIYLCELALDFANKVLGPKGQFLVKVFQGTGFDEFRKQVVDSFDVLKTAKPAASRARSKEVFLIGQGRKKSFAIAGVFEVCSFFVMNCQQMLAKLLKIVHFCTFLTFIAKFITRFLLRSSKIEPDQNSYIWE